MLDAFANLMVWLDGAGHELLRVDAAAEVPHDLRAPRQTVSHCFANRCQQHTPT